MHLLIISATQTEIAKTAGWFENHSFGINALKPKLLISGIGQMQTTYHLTQAIQEGRPDLIIQAGIGGATSKEDITRVFVIRSERLGDLGVMENAGFTPFFDLGLDSPDRYPFSKGKLENPYHSLIDWTRLPQREAVTVNEIKSSDFTGFQRNSIPVVESMEGAALHYVGLMEKIPFLQIRSVSNVLGERDKNQWKIKESVDNLNATLISLIQNLEQSDENLFGI